MFHENYNGYTNRPTWAVALHYDNDRAKYDARMAVLCDAVESGKTKEETVEILEEFLTDSIYESMEGIDGLLYDLIDVSQINFREIAESYVDEASSLFRNGDIGGFIADCEIARAESSVIDEE